MLISKEYDSQHHRSNLKDDCFEYVTEISKDYTKGKEKIFSWQFRDINESIMYSTHKSWVYVICIDDIIVKLGETELPLGIRSQNFYVKFCPNLKEMTHHRQPAKDGNRLGRLATYASKARDNDTDITIRRAIDKFLQEHRIQIFARKCPIIDTKIEIIESIRTIPAKIHKILEMEYLKMFDPILNKIRK
jgi:hypothetical protein